MLVGGFGGSHAFRGLFKVAFTRTAATETRLNIGKNLAMLGDIDLGDSDNPRIARYLDIGADRVERDQFRAFVHACRSGIDARGLTPDIIDRRKSIEQKLTHHDRLVGLRHPGRVSSEGRREVRLIKSVVAGARLKPYLRQQRALGLAKFCVGRAPICCGLADARMRFYRVIDGVINREGLCRDGGPNSASEQS